MVPTFAPQIGFAGKSPPPIGHFEDMDPVRGPDLAELEGHQATTPGIPSSVAKLNGAIG
jgi:hypothetical protein